MRKKIAPAHVAVERPSGSQEVADAALEMLFPELRDHRSFRPLSCDLIACTEHAAYRIFATKKVNFLCVAHFQNFLAHPSMAHTRSASGDDVLPQLWLSYRDKDPNEPVSVRFLHSYELKGCES